MSDLDDEAKKDLEQDPRLKQDTEKEAEKEGQNAARDFKKDL